MADIHAKKQIRRTICEVHREIYKELKKRDPNEPLLKKLEESFNMAKKMDNKLRQYKYNWDDGWWEINKLTGETELDSQKRKIFIDLGAHNGCSVELFLSRFATASEFEIFSFECNPRLVEAYKSKFPFAKYNLYNSAASTSDGKSVFYIGGDLSSSLRADKTSGMRDRTPITVDTTDISHFITKNFSKDDFILIKMDIEGAEYDILPKMLEDGLFDGYINALYGEWHHTKLNNVSEETHTQLVHDLKDKGVKMKAWCGETGYIEN